jgi:DNA-binding LacI/PurR family transcriptional regulator
MVMADRTIRLDCDLVVVDNIDGAMQVTRHLLSLGHSEIGLITGPRGVTTGAERYEGYRQAMAERGLKCRFELVREGDYRQQSGYEHTKEFLRLKNPPTAVFACNDLMALGAMDALEEEGLRIPEDVAVVGYDDTLLASTVRPRLTTVAQPKYEIGAIAAEMLIKRIASHDIPVRQVVLKPQLIIRDTSVVRAGTPRSRTFLCGGGL